MIGKCLNNRYQIEDEIGAGGMSLVYEATDKLLNRKVAVKVLRPQFATDKEFIERFKREAQAVANFTHPNIVNIFDIGEDNGTHYIVMENVQGETLKDRIEKQGNLSPVSALEITKQVCNALVTAHRKQIVHCDIKPGNILIASGGTVKLTDFGIARAVTSSSTLKQTDTVIGSAAYFSPEQARGDRLDNRTDIYSLGIVLYEMLTGEVPFTGDTPVSVALKHIKEDPKPPTEFDHTIPGEVENIILKAVNKEPKKRYTNVKEMLIDLKETLEDLEKTEKDSLDESESDIDKDDKTIVMSKNDYPTKRISDYKKTKQISNFKDNESIKEESVTRTKNEEIEEVGYTQPQKSSFWNRNRSLMIWFLVLALITGGLVFSYYQVTNYLEVPVVEVPNLVDKDLKTARQILEKKGLHLKVYNRNYNNNVPEDHIISHHPESGKKVKKNRKISVVVSKGAKLTKIPDVIGERLREAKILIEEADLEVGEVNYVFSDRIKKGLIIDQSPSSKKEVKVDTKVDLIISKGKEAEAIEAPKLVGLSEKNAKSKLRNLNLIIGKVKYKKSLNYFEGKVMKQEPKPGSEIVPGSPVNLVISKGIRNPYNSEVHEFKIRVNINPGEKDQRVKIIVRDDNGRRIIYNQIHHPGDLVDKRIISVGSTVVKVYINDKLVREQRL
ncbi:Stk1 family PASTA domain-containing Ser/Thr kinase [Sporohalobacter salinus]|uniref:Stk1 family PASTA domain-containing Ser/Thr kinase n=1 Tax=Sporohalobacter salinus TaxID=1494606 RepID=UPI0019618B6F|nr:Stk1 family PASTA domain-containing Ser/Thr kinase [Sporohalobacter salinus]MBM7623313.1 serine/threonine-protein kinase [Sporohalobacter salinus]